MENRVIILDTNVLLHEPNAFFSFKGDRIVIPMTVIEEVDTFKKNVDEKGRSARQINRFLDKLRDSGSLQDGVEMENGSIIQVVWSKKIESIIDDVMISDENDNRILGTALFIQKEYAGKEVILVSKDANVRIKADALGLKSENFEADSVKFEELYTGYIDFEAESDVYNEYIEKKTMPAPDLQLYPNQFVRLINKGNTEETILTRYYHEDKSLRELKYYKSEDYIFGIKSRNAEQEMALELLLDDNVKLVTLVGKAGTGKTLLAIAAGLQKVIEDNKYHRLVISRPISPLGKDIGYLPGSKMEKFNPWMQPIYDNMEILINMHSEVDEDNRNGKLFNKKRPSINDLLDLGFIELEPLTYIRGRSLPDQFIIIDEAQNLTPHEMKTIITRAGERTKIVMTGDPYQIDIPYLDSESNGLSMSVEKFKSEHIIGHITLEKGERSQLADIAARHF